MNWTRHDTRALIEAAEDVPRISIGMVKAVRRHHAEVALVDRMARFERFMAETMETRHAWGRSDCSLMVADWCMANGYTDPAAALRGAYTTEDECRSLVALRGDLCAVVTDCAELAGLKPISEPQFGCVAVIGSPSNADRQWSAIWSGHKWMVRWMAADGRPMWARFTAKPLKMWRV